MGPHDAHGGNVYVPLLGERLLPEAVNSQRRSMRTRLRNLRDPLRSFRENNIPGPNVIGELEDRAIQTRDRFVTRDMALSRLQDLRSNGLSVGGNGNGEENNENGGTERSETSRRSEANNPTLQ